MMWEEYSLVAISSLRRRVATSIRNSSTTIKMLFCPPVAGRRSLGGDLGVGEEVIIFQRNYSFLYYGQSFDGLLLCALQVSTLLITENLYQEHKNRKSCVDLLAPRSCKAPAFSQSIRRAAGDFIPSPFSSPEKLVNLPPASPGGNCGGGNCGGGSRAIFMVYCCLVFSRRQFEAFPARFTEVESHRVSIKACLGRRLLGL